MAEGILINTDGTTKLVVISAPSDLDALLGKRRVLFEGETLGYEYHLHELNRVAFIPINTFVSRISGRFVGGPAVLLGNLGENVEPTILTKDRRAKIERECCDEDLKARMMSRYQEKTNRPMFNFFPPDRWLMNGAAFSAITISDSRGFNFLDNTADVSENTFDVWLFKNIKTDPATLRLSGYSLVQAMELMIEGDELVSLGKTPPYLKAAARKLGF